MPFKDSGTLTTDKRTVDVSTEWATQTDWEAYQSQTNINITTGTLKLADESGIPESVVSQYDAREESSTGEISSISDLIGSFDLSGSASVISSGINSQQTYRFDTSDVMEHASSITTTDPFAVVGVIQQQEATGSGHVWFDGGSNYEFVVFDNGDYRAYRGSSSIDSTTAMDQQPHVVVLEGYSSDQVRLEVDGTEVLNGTASSGDLTGLILGSNDNNGSDRQSEIDVGQLEVLNNHTSSELNSVRDRLASNWGITI